MEKFKSRASIKMDPGVLEKILKENPGIKHNEEYFLIDVESKEGKQTHYIPKRNSMELKTKNNQFVTIPTEKIIKAIKKYPDKPLNESLKLIEGD